MARSLKPRTSPNPSAQFGLGKNPPIRDPYMDGTPGDWGNLPEVDGGLLFKEIGTLGLRQFGGWLREEFLRALVGREASRVYREMYDNSSVISAMLFAISQSMRKINWRTEAADDTPDAQEAADFAESIRTDMSHTWDELIVEALSMLHFGYSIHEIVWKKRDGTSERTEWESAGEGKPPLLSVKSGSKFDDGLIGVARLPLRGQETTLRWYFDVNGQILGVQQQPWLGPLLSVPFEKMLLFRAQHYKNNPEGRALHPDTLMPTPDGWKILDDVCVGDKVFDENGEICYVTGRKDWSDRPCYKITFDEDTEITADENHLWSVQTLQQRREGTNRKLVSTKDLTGKLFYKVGNYQVAKYSIPWAKPVDYQEQDLPIDPYLFGLWLGNGHNESMRISCHSQDVKELAHYIEGRDFTPRIVKNSENGARIIVEPVGQGYTTSLGQVLREYNLYKNKHLPRFYLHSSIAQRQALLCGLMDSDGDIKEHGQCAFSNTNYDLVSGVLELVRSLGSGHVMIEVEPKQNENWAQRWFVRFTPNFIPFRLSRKVARYKPRITRQNHYIHKVEKVANSRTVCIEVSSSSHQFLVSESFIATHNSILRSSYRPYYFIKRMEEQEAIMFERLSGLPVLKVPNALLEAAAAGQANAQTALTALKKIVTNVRIDEQMGIVLPSDTWQGPNGPTNIPMYDFELLTPRSTSLHVSSDVMIKRYNLDILKTVLADFIDLGHQARGTQNLAINKVDMFYQAVEGWLNSMASVFNRYLIPRLWQLNGLDRDIMPRYVPDLAQRVDLDVLSNFVLRLAQAGARMFPDTDLENFLRDSAGLPEINEDLYNPNEPPAEVRGSVVDQPSSGNGSSSSGSASTSTADRSGDRSSTSPTASPTTAGGSVAKWLAEEVLPNQIKQGQRPYQVFSREAA